MSAPPHAFQYWDQLLQPIHDAVQQAASRSCVVGTHGAMGAFALSVLTRADGPSFLIVTASDEDAERVYDDVHFFHTMLGLSSAALAFFPEWETLPYEPTAPAPELIAKRARTLHRLTEGARTVLVTSIPALLQRLMPVSVFVEGCAQLKAGGTLEREALIARLLRLGYRRGSVVEIPGEFSVRGGILDIYSTAYDDPLRIELLGDTIESIRHFDPATQTSTAKLSQALLLPARELLHPADRSEALEPRPPDAEWRSPEVYASMDTLLDYFHQPPILVLDQPQALAKKST